MYAVFIWALLLRQHKGMKPNSEIMWVFLKTLVYILSLFKWHAPLTRGSSCLSLPSHAPLRPAIYIHPEEVFICLLFAAFLPDNHLRIPPVPRRGKGVKGGMGLLDNTPYRCGWHHLPCFPFTGQQHLCQPDEVTAPSHLLGSNNEDRSLSCSAGCGAYCWMHTTPQNSCV